MATSQHLLLSPAELAYLHGALRLSPPVRQDGRAAAQFRPLVAETGVLPGAIGSARVCLADGTEAIVGVKAEVEKTATTTTYHYNTYRTDDDGGGGGGGGGRRRRGGGGGGGGGGVTATGREEDGEAQRGEEEEEEEEEAGGGENDWVEITVEIPGHRDDDPSTVFLATMLGEALLADGGLTKRLWINRRFHWKLYLDIVLISPPLSYPLPLLSLTAHLALLSARLPRLRSEADEDPMFDDDWAASTFIYPRRRRQRRRRRRRQDEKKTSSSSSSSSPSLPSAPAPSPRPPITLLVISVGDNIIFDPSREELAVADSALAVSVGEAGDDDDEDDDESGVEAADVDMDKDGDGKATEAGRNLRLLSVRTIDPPSRLTAPGVPNAVNAAAWGLGAGAGATGGAPAKDDPGARQAATTTTTTTTTETDDVEGVWKPPRGGARIAVLGAMVRKVLERGGVADEVLDGLDGVELG